MPDSLSLKVLGTFSAKDILSMHLPNMAPTFETIQPEPVQLNDNATSIPTTGGDGTLGYLVLSIGQTAYQALSLGNVNHPPPAAPPDAPTFPQNSTGAQISEARRTFNDTVHGSKFYHTVDAVLKQQLLTSIDDTYVKVHKNRNTGYARVTTITLVKNLLNTYGQIKPDDLINNEERMKCKWDATTPIEIVFSQIDDGQAYATSRNSPYMDAQIVRMAYNLAFQSRNMKEACCDWLTRPVNDQTWTNFVQYFKASHLDLQHEATSESAGFQAHFAKQAQLIK